MQFIVFAAFAIVLSVPEGGPPWARITSNSGTLWIVIGQIVLAALVGVIWTRLVQLRLEAEPAWLPSAQRRLSQGNSVLRMLLAVGLLTSVYFTNWVKMVRSWQIPLSGDRSIGVASIWGLDELIILLPFFISIVLSWITFYPADRAVRQVALELRLWASVPARPVWRLGQYLSFQLRQHVLIILLPMLPIAAANDFAYAYSKPIRQYTGVAWADQAVLVIMAGLVFLLAPVMLRYVWHTHVLPPSDLRDRLENLCKRTGLTYRRILIWESDGMVVNAAVMGLFRPVRYILLSDGLLEMMDDQKIEAVFGHEAGHVKHRHIEFYLLFAIFSMLLVGGIFELVQRAIRYYPGLIQQTAYLQDYLQVAAVGVIIAIWGIGFGAISRRFEWQADLFGARTVTPPADACDQPCFVHGTANPATPTTAVASGAVCSTAANVFAEALHRIAVLNGIPVEARSWRHSSIGNRMRLLKQYSDDPATSRQLERAVIFIKVLLLFGTLVGLGIGLWLYWPKS